jgi:AmmeMemoRadiSam system protein A
VGVFVTLLSARALRGCVGSAAATEPLWLAVKRLAIKAASADPRFPPVEEAELPSLEVEITCLGALVDVPGSFPLERLRPEEHGVWLRLRGRSGLLLPQVARRQGWDLHELLDQVAVKAGLQPGAWRERGARLQAFTAWSFTAPAPPDGGGGGGSG